MIPLASTLTQRPTVQQCNRRVTAETTCCGNWDPTMCPARYTSDQSGLSPLSTTVFFSVVYRGGSVSTHGTRRMNTWIKKAGSTIGSRKETFEALVEDDVQTDNQDHLANPTLSRQRNIFSKRLKHVHYLSKYLRRYLLLRAVNPYYSYPLCDP